MHTIPNYSLLHCIATGAYGEVWLAQNKHGDFCALKVVQRQAEKEERFEREWHAIDLIFARPDPIPGLIPILQATRLSNDLFFYAMPLADDLSGGRTISPTHYQPYTLRAYLDIHRTLPVSETLILAQSLGNTLHALHSRNLIHRDVKPANVLMFDGVPYLADVGLITICADALSIVGTFGYAPPENHGTFSGDIYSLGKLLYECLTGNNPATAYGHSPREESDLAAPHFAKLLALIQRACNDNPRNRYETAQAFLSDLKGLVVQNSFSVDPTFQGIKRFLCATVPVFFKRVFICIKWLWLAITAIFIEPLLIVNDWVIEKVILKTTSVCVKRSISPINAYIGKRGTRTKFFFLAFFVTVFSFITYLATKTILKNKTRPPPPYFILHVNPPETSPPSSAESKGRRRRHNPQEPSSDSQPLQKLEPHLTPIENQTIEPIFLPETKFGFFRPLYAPDVAPKLSFKKKL